VASIANLKRVHGVALAHELNKGFISDSGDNAIVVFDLKSNAVMQRVKVGDAPDAVLYEPTKRRVYAFNAHSHSASVIDAETEKIVATVPLSGIPEFAASDGKGNVFVNIENKSTLVRFDADGTKVQNEGR
jgi:YVTN family beta-propeller protein